MSPRQIGSSGVSVRRVPAARRAWAGALSLALTVGAALGGFSGPVTAAAASTDIGESVVSGAVLDWGVKESFRKYIYDFAVFEGSATLLGNAQQASTNGSYQWTDGVGAAAADGSTASIAFGEGNGIHVQSHPMAVAGQEEPEYALNMTFTNPQVVVTSSTAGQLLMDVEGRTFQSTTELGEPYALKGAVIATLELPAPTVNGDVWTWAGAAAQLTEQGASAFGGFYPQGELLDPLTFSLPLAAIDTESGGENPGPGVPAEATETATVIASSSSLAVVEGAAASFTAEVLPAQAAGSVQFSAGGQPLGEPVEVAAGRARLLTKSLTAGTHEITATFLPSDSALFAESISRAHTVTVTKPSGGSSKIEDATLDWGVRESFRKYIYDFTMFEGRTALVGNTKQDGAKGSYLWSNGAGTAAIDGSTADVAFGAGNGVHFQSHPMTVGGKRVYALDLKFTNPRIVISSASSAMLHMDVDGYTFEGMDTVGRPFSLRDAPIATLALGVPTTNAESTLLSWKNVGALLTQEGEVAFGGFYQAGDALDPLNFSLPGDFTVVEKTATSVTLSASPVTTTVGKEVTFTAKVAPDVAGSVTFRYGTTALGPPVRVLDGIAILASTKLPEGVYSAYALFEPEDSAQYHHANSNGVKLTIDSAKKPQTTPPTTPQRGQGAGSLSWGISKQFVGYTTAKSNTAACPTAGKHCAGGEIATNGVGAGYLFPQAGSTWNAATQTGSVSYSGSVSFNGYGTTMFRVANPTITVTSETTATLTTGYAGSYGPSSVQLDLGAATKTVGAGGEVTWSNVPVIGSLMGISATQSIAFDSLSFTVGSVSKVSYGQTTAGKSKGKSKYIAAATPPTTTGLTVVTDPDKLVPGARIEIQAAGFDPEDEGVLVVLYSEPIVLDDTAAADRFGVVHWTGKLPDTIEPGPHVLTVQGSADAGAKITVLPKDKTKASATQRDNAAGTPTVLSAADTGTEPALAGAGMALWEWWVIALSLVMIAGCTSALAVRQRARPSA